MNQNACKSVNIYIYYVYKSIETFGISDDEQP
ncbi:MAG: hypothetical protein ACJAUH_001099 [Saprospiraceae bacterium]|jgi:hypothetical protein